MGHLASSAAAEDNEAVVEVAAAAVVVAAESDSEVAVVVAVVASPSAAACSGLVNPYLCFAKYAKDIYEHKQPPALDLGLQATFPGFEVF